MTLGSSNISINTHHQCTAGGIRSPDDAAPLSGWPPELLCQSNGEVQLLENNGPFEVLLIIHNIPGHPPFIGYLNCNIGVVFLPPNTTSLIQPMDRGVLTAF